MVTLEGGRTLPLDPCSTFPSAQDFPAWGAPSTERSQAAGTVSPAPSCSSPHSPPGHSGQDGGGSAAEVSLASWVLREGQADLQDTGFALGAAGKHQAHWLGEVKTKTSLGFCWPATRPWPTQTSL